MKLINTIRQWMFEGRDQSRFEILRDSLRTIVEVVALIVAGWWAWEHFLRTEAPGLRNNLKIESSLKWFDSKSAGYCWGQVTLGIENASKSSVEIGTVTREAWYFSLPVGQEKDIEAWDVLKLPRENQSTQTVSEGPVTWSFPPSASVKQEFSWNIKQKMDYYTVFKFGFFEKLDNGSIGKEIASNYIFGPTCGIAAATNATP